MPLHYGLLTRCAATHRGDLGLREHMTLTFTNKIPPRSRQNHTAPLCAPLLLRTASQEGLILLDLYFARGSTSRRAPPMSLSLSLSVYRSLLISLSSSVVSIWPGGMLQWCRTLLLRGFSAPFTCLSVTHTDTTPHRPTLSSQISA